MSFDPNQSAQASAQDQQALDDVLSPERISAFESLSARSFEMMVLIIICVSLLLFALIVLYAYEVEEFAVSFVWLAGGIGAGIGLLMLLVIANAFPSPEASRLLTAVTNVIGAVAMTQAAPFRTFRREKVDGHDGLDGRPAVLFAAARGNQLRLHRLAVQYFQQ